MNVVSQRAIKVFKIKNRSGFAAICDDHLTEGKSEAEALDRMVKALTRTSKNEPSS
jgi:hypothetical protein